MRTRGPDPPWENRGSSFPPRGGGRRVLSQHEAYRTCVSDRLAATCVSRLPYGGLQFPGRTAILTDMGRLIDLYGVLEVAPTADAAAIRLAYRRLARRHHPDVGGTDRRMAVLNEAWRVLRSPDERALYDARRAAAAAASAAVAAAVVAQSHDPAPAWAREPVAAASAAAARPVSSRVAGPGAPPGSTVLSFGRYEGWSLAQLAVRDPCYLEWLARTSIGRGLEHEIRAVLTRPSGGMRTGAGLRRAFAGR